MSGERDISSSSNSKRLESLYGRLLRIEAERGATFEELLSFSPLLGRRLLEVALTRADSVRVGSSGARDTQRARRIGRCPGAGRGPSPGSPSSSLRPDGPDCPDEEMTRPSEVSLNRRSSGSGPGCRLKGPKR